MEEQGEGVLMRQMLDSYKRAEAGEAVADS